MDYSKSTEFEDFPDIALAYSKYVEIPKFERHQPKIIDMYPEAEFLWLNLYIKLDFEETIRYLNERPDFKRLYAK